MYSCTPKRTPTRNTTPKIHTPEKSENNRNRSHGPILGGDKILQL